jgi:hypothetical protein
MKAQDDILLEQAYSKILLKENESTHTLSTISNLLNDKEKMIQKISEILPSLDVEDLPYVLWYSVNNTKKRHSLDAEDLKHLQDHLFGGDVEDSEKH